MNKENTTNPRIYSRSAKSALTLKPILPFKFLPALLLTTLCSLALIKSGQAQELVPNRMPTPAFSPTPEPTPSPSPTRTKHIDRKCEFDYWQLIPDDLECDVFYLPDFDFRRLPEDPKVDIRLKRFCENFEVRYANTSKVVSYCKDPNKDGSGPTFEIDGKTYQADIYYEGCYRGEYAYGKVFTNKYWSSAPRHISRLWRMKDKDSTNNGLNCKKTG